jgi:hypothetical protein
VLAPAKAQELARRHRRLTQRGVALSIVVTDETPPSEFRIFTAGEVETTKGTFVFDDVAAQSVMADYEAHGIDLMIDYDHASLGSMADPALAGRAAGWFNLELRDGELWAVNVRWTQVAANALVQKEWRFMSPAFELSDGDRISKLINVALTNIPATRQLEPLMAANSKRQFIMANDSGLSPKLIAGALDAVANKDAKSALDLMKQFLAQLLGGDPDAGTEDAPPPAGDGGADENTEGMPAVASIAASMARASSFVAAGRQAMALTGTKDVGSAITELARTHKIAVDLEKREEKLAADRATLEAGERRSLVASLVKLGYEIPALAWSDEKGTVPSDLYAKMPIESLRDRVSMLSAKGARSTGVTPPKSTPAETESGLSDREQQLIKAKKIDPATYVEMKNQITRKA